MYYEVKMKKKKKSLSDCLQTNNVIYSEVSNNQWVWEEMSKYDVQHEDCGGHLWFSIGSFTYFVSQKLPNAHHQVSIQLDYKGAVQNMNSQHFSHINV